MSALFWLFAALEETRRKSRLTFTGKSIKPWRYWCRWISFLKLSVFLNLFTLGLCSSACLSSLAKYRSLNNAALINIFCSFNNYLLSIYSRPWGSSIEQSTKSLPWLNFCSSGKRQMINKSLYIKSESCKCCGDAQSWRTPGWSLGSYWNSISDKETLEQRPEGDKGTTQVALLGEATQAASKASVKAPGTPVFCVFDE